MMMTSNDEDNTRFIDPPIIKWLYKKEKKRNDFTIGYDNQVLYSYHVIVDKRG
jgi:hypothetical protein